MKVAGPSSRVSIDRFTRGERVKSTYEEDLLGLLDQLSPDEIDDLQTFFAHRMQIGLPSSDHDVAMIHLLQQVRGLAEINEDRVLAQRIADEEDIGTETEETTDEEDVGTETEESTDREDVGTESEEITDEGDTRTESEESASREDDGLETEESSDGEDVRTETEESVGREDVGPETEERESSDGEDVEAETEANGHQRHGVWTVRNRIARLLPRRSWVSTLKSRLFGLKPMLARRASTSVPGIPAIHSLTGHDCVVCRDPIRGVEIRAPCGHFYDIGCTTHLFQSAIRDETFFPPRCCGQNIPFYRVRPHLSRTLVMTFQQKQVEFGTLRRVYCSSPTCSRFLGTVSEGVFGGRVYTCPALRCRRRTCGKCRQQHSGDRTHICRPDADDAQVLELSRAAGWARCPGCSHMIELYIGCFHTTCRCQTEFCYLCHALWKTCSCPQWEEQRLVVTDEETDDE